MLLQKIAMRETVVAAIECLQVGPHGNVVDALHFSDMGVEIHGIEMTRHQTALALTQRVQGLGQTAADTAGRRKMGEKERFQGRTGK